MWIKCEMFTGRIVTGHTLNSKAEAIAENQTLMSSGSQYRWIQSLRELGLWEKSTKENATAKELMEEICQ